MPKATSQAATTRAVSGVSGQGHSVADRAGATKSATPTTSMIAPCTISTRGQPERQRLPALRVDARHPLLPDREQRQRDRHHDVDPEPEPGREPGDRAVRAEVEAVPVQQRRDQRQRAEDQHGDHRHPGVRPGVRPQREQHHEEAGAVPGAEERRGQRRPDRPGEPRVGVLGQHVELVGRRARSARRTRPAAPWSRATPAARPRGQPRPHPSTVAAQVKPTQVPLSFPFVPTLPGMPGETAPEISTPDRRVRVFVSSTLQELADERRAARDRDQPAAADPGDVRAGRPAAPAARALPGLPGAERRLRRHLLAPVRLGGAGRAGVRPGGRVPAVRGPAEADLRQGGRRTGSRG